MDSLQLNPYFFGTIGTIYHVKSLQTKDFLNYYSSKGGEGHPSQKQALVCINIYIKNKIFLYIYTLYLWIYVMMWFTCLPREGVGGRGLPIFGRIDVNSPSSGRLGRF